MKIVVSKENLEAALSVVMPSLGGGGDISSHILFHLRDGSCECKSFSGRVFSSCNLPVETEDAEGAFTVEGKRIRQWLSAVNDSTLILTAANGQVTATAPRGEIVFMSMDPASFPSWDEIVADAGDGQPVSAKRFSRALNHVKHFVSNDDTKSPNLCSAEVREDLMLVSNRIVASTVKVDGLEGTTLRIHGKDMPALDKFLSKAGDADVMLSEHDKAMIVRRDDGALFGWSRFVVPFPDLNVSGFFRESPHWWDVTKDEIRSGIAFVQAGADDEEKDISFESKDGGVFMMMNAAFSRKQTKLRLDVKNQGQVEDAPEMPDGGFKIRIAYLNALLSVWEGDIVRFEMYPGPNGAGYTRVQEDRSGDTYTTIFAWIR